VTISTSPFRRESSTVRSSSRFAVLVPDLFSERIVVQPSRFKAAAGFLTSSVCRGASVFKMRDVSRHKSMDVLQACVRDADLFRDHAGAELL
jgi:hypothetical protein